MLKPEQVALRRCGRCQGQKKLKQGQQVVDCPACKGTGVQRPAGYLTK